MPRSPYQFCGTGSSARGAAEATLTAGPAARAGRRAIVSYNPGRPQPQGVRRFAILVGLCVAAAVLVVGFGAWFNGTDAYPDPEALDADYGAHIGETVHVWGEVTAVDDGRVVVTAGDALSLRVTEPTAERVRLNDRVQVYGRLESDRRLDTTDYDVQSPGALRNMYAVSVVGVALAGGAFLRRWRVDTDRWAFVPREDG